MKARLVMMVVVAAAGAVGAAFAAAPPRKVRLQPRHDATATGTAIVRPNGVGTLVTVELRGLPPREHVAALLHAGTCSRPSSSVAQILTATASATGQLRARGPIRFHGTPVAFTTVTTGPHTIAIISGILIVACGQIPEHS